MKIIKRILLDFLMIGLLFAFSVLLAGIISMNNPDCYTCGANIALTFFGASILSLQPVVWVSGLKKSKRFLIWFMAMIIGGGVYILLENVAGNLFLSGNSYALKLGLYANDAYYLLALLISILSVRYFKSRDPENSNDDTLVSNQLNEKS